MPLLSVKTAAVLFFPYMNKQQIQEVVYSIREVYERNDFTPAEFSAILMDSGFKYKERLLIIRRSLMWGYIIKCSDDIKVNYRIVDIDRVVRTRTLHHGRHGNAKQ
jgi:hypothetical protein